MRQGVGEIRHLHIKQLWLQEKVARGDPIITKIPRRANWSDALTHPWTVADIPFWNSMGLRFIPPPSQTQYWISREEKTSTVSDRSVRLVVSPVVYRPSR